MLSVWFWRIFVVGVFVYLIARIIDSIALKNKDDD
jgi:hypothetical protein